MSLPPPGNRQGRVSRDEVGGFNDKYKLLHQVLRLLWLTTNIYSCNNAGKSAKHSLFRSLIKNIKHLLKSQILGGLYLSRGTGPDWPLGFRTLSALLSGDHVTNG